MHRLVAGVWAVWLAIACAWGQEERGRADPPAVTVEDVRHAAAGWEASDLPEATRRLLATLAAEAEAALVVEEQARGKAESFRRRIESLPEEIAALREAIAREPEPAGALPEVSRDGNRGDVLEVALATAQEEVEKAKQELAQVTAERESREVRRRELSALPAAIAAEAAAAAEAAPVPPDAPAPVALARSLVAAAGRQSRSARLEAVQAELACYDAEAGTGVLLLREQAAEANLARLRKRQESLRAQVDAVRAAEAAAAAREAAASESAAPEELRGELAGVTRLADENRHLVEGLIPEANRRLTETEAEVARWMETSSRTRERIRRLGASGAVGVELRRQLQDLPSVPALRAAADERQAELIAVETKRLALEEELSDLPPETGPEAAGDAALRGRRGVLNELVKNYGRYFNLLVRLNESAGQLEAVVRAEREFAYEQILWMPSAPPAGPGNLPAFRASLQWVLGGLAGGVLPREWMAGVERAPWERAILPVLPAVPLLLMRRRAARRLSQEADAAEGSEAPFAATARAVLWTILLVLPWPYVLWALARPLLLSGDPFALAWGEGMTLAAMVLPGLEFLRQSLRPKGLAEAHFYWKPEGIVSLRRQMRRSVILITPTVWIGGVFSHAISMRHDSAWRMCLLILLGAMGWWLHRFWQTARRAQQGGTGDDLRGSAWLGWMAGHVVSVAVPLVLAVLALRGYLYTAEVLTGRLALSLLALAGFILLRELFLRWYSLHRARLRAARARRLREVREASRSAAARESPAGTGPAVATGNDLAVDVATDQFRGQDIDESGEQMRRLVGVVAFPVVASVLWFIWADVMPAARRLSAPPPARAAVATPREGQPAGSGTLQSSPPPAAPAAAPVVTGAKRRVVNLPGVLLAAATAVITWMAARRIPGALQFALSSRITMDAGTRFALGTVTRYIIIIAGTAVALRSIGLSWSSVQWLAAALTVGLGFGLQEIFANFFSGLIILFERPIRPGDVVTIDNITGTVARIQIRATTIRTADYTEYIVPNREFITGKLLNWTLTDTISRMTVQVGVDFRTDIPKALEILQRIADEHPDVRKDPPPSIACEGFQDSSINLVLRYYVSSLDKRLSSLSDIHCRIAAEFAAAGIRIPFPARDLSWLQSLPPSAGSGEGTETA